MHSPNGRIEDNEDPTPAVGGESPIEAPAAQRRAGVWPAIMLVVLLLGALAGLTKLWLDRQAAIEALSVALTTLPAKVGDPVTLELVRRQLQVITEDAQAGRFVLVKQRLENLRPPADTRQPPKDEVLPPEGEAFLRDHPDLLRLLLHYAKLSRELKDQGMDVQPLRDVRDAVLNAARMQDADAVKAQLDDYAQLLREAGADPDSALAEGTGGPVRGKLQRIQQAFRKAQEGGRDISAAAKLMPQLEAAVDAGDLEKASSLADEVLSKLKSGPQARRRLLPRPGRPAGPPPGLAQRLLGAFISLAQAEDQDLAHIQETINNAKLAVLEKNAEQVKEILGRATETLGYIWARRRGLSETIAAAMAAHQPQRKPGQEQPPEQKPRPAGPVARIIDFLRRVRGLSDEEFQQRERELARELLSATIPRRPPPQVVQQIQQELPPDEAQQTLDAAAEARIRAKLQIAAEPYQLLKRQGTDTEELDQRLKQTREALYAGDYDIAERLIDEVLEKLQMELAAATEETPDEAPAAEGQPDTDVEASDAQTSEEGTD